MSGRRGEVVNWRPSLPICSVFIYPAAENLLGITLPEIQFPREEDYSFSVSELCKFRETSLFPGHRKGCYPQRGVQLEYWLTILWWKLFYGDAAWGRQTRKTRNHRYIIYSPEKRQTLETHLSVSLKNASLRMQPTGLANVSLVWNIVKKTHSHTGVNPVGGR